MSHADMNNVLKSAKNTLHRKTNAQRIANNAFNKVKTEAKQKQEEGTRNADNAEKEKLRAIGAKRQNIAWKIQAFTTDAIVKPTSIKNQENAYGANSALNEMGMQFAHGAEKSKFTQKSVAATNKLRSELGMPLSSDPFDSRLCKAIKTLADAQHEARYGKLRGKSDKKTHLYFGKLKV